MGFRWLEVLEKEFDKSFVDLDILLGDIDEEQQDIALEGRERMTRLSAAFAQLCHKSESIFHQNSHLETQLVAMRSEVCQLRSLKTVLERQINDLVYQVHDAQLQLCHLKEPSTKDASSPLRNGLVDPEVIRQKLADHKTSTETNGEKETLDQRRLTEELEQVKKENAVWKQQALTLRGEVIGAKLAAKYSAKELAGRVQQLQLLIREKEMKLEPEMQQKLWNQLEAEINLHRHKTIIRECRSSHPLTNGHVEPAADESADDEPRPGELRTAFIRKRENQRTMGLSITGGNEHGVPILISEIHPGTAAAECGRLHVGDAILFVNGRDLREVPHEDAVKILSEAAAQQEITLEVLYIHPDPDELANREVESRAEVAKEISTSEYPIFDPSLLRGLDGLTVQTNDEYSGLGNDARFWDPHEPPFVNIEPPDIMIDEGHQQTASAMVHQEARPERPPASAEVPSDSASSSRSAVVTVTEAIVPAMPTTTTEPPLSFTAARVETSDNDDDGENEDENPIASMRIGSRLSQHSNSQMLDFAQLENRAAGATTEQLSDQEHHSGHEYLEQRNSNLVNGAEAIFKEAAEQTKTTDDGSAATAIAASLSGANASMNGRDLGAPSLIPNYSTATNVDGNVPSSDIIKAIPAPLQMNRNPLPTSAPATSSSSQYLPERRADAPFAHQTNADLPPAAGNSFSQYAFPYPIQGRDAGQAALNPFPYPLNGGNQGAASTAPAPCAYPYPRDREKILKGTMMLSPSIAGLGGGGGGVTRYYLPPQDEGDHLNQSPPPAGYKNRDTKILY